MSRSSLSSVGPLVPRGPSPTLQIPVEQPLEPVSERLAELGERFGERSGKAEQLSLFSKCPLTPKLLESTVRGHQAPGSLGRVWFPR